MAIPLRRYLTDILSLPPIAASLLALCHIQFPIGRIHRVFPTDLHRSRDGVPRLTFYTRLRKTQYHFIYHAILTTDWPVSTAWQHKDSQELAIFEQRSCRNSHSHTGSPCGQPLRAIRGYHEPGASVAANITHIGCCNLPTTDYIYIKLFTFNYAMTIYPLSQIIFGTGIVITQPKPSA